MLASCLLPIIPFLPFSSACAGHLAALQASNATNPLTIGNDGPADSATLGFTINHFSLNVNNMTATRHFYGEVLGLRHIFSYAASPDYELTYMGLSHGGKNSTAFQSGPELLASKNNMEGLIEFVYLNTNSSLPSSGRVGNTFSHIGLIVPDVQAAQDRFGSYGVQILKRIGEDPVPGSPIATAFGIGAGRVPQGVAEEVLVGIKALGFGTFCVVADPDGNLIEVQQQDSEAV